MATQEKLERNNMMAFKKKIQKPNFLLKTILVSSELIET